jgi:hypothetical protein
MTLELIDARRAFDLGKTDTAQRTYDSATRYFEQFQLSSRASFATYEGNLESARRLADRIYRTSKFAAKFLASHSGIPGAVYTIDALFTLTDFGVTQSDVGWSGATEELFINIAAGVIMKTPTESLGGKSLSQALQGDATKMIGKSDLYRLLGKVSDDPKFKAELMRKVANNAAAGVAVVSESQVEVFLKRLKTLDAS